MSLTKPESSNFFESFREKLVLIFPFFLPLKNRFNQTFQWIKKNNPISKIKFKLIRWFLYGFLIIVLVFIAIDFNLLWFFGYSPTVNDIKNPEYSVASEIYSADGKLIGKFFKENRTPVKFEELPQNLIDALVSTEDTRFYKHMGIDLYSFFASIWSTTKGIKEEEVLLLNNWLKIFTKQEN